MKVGLVTNSCVCSLAGAEVTVVVVLAAVVSKAGLGVVTAAPKSLPGRENVLVPRNARPLLLRSL